MPPNELNKCFVINKSAKTDARKTHFLRIQRQFCAARAVRLGLIDGSKLPASKRAQAPALQIKQQLLAYIGVSFAVECAFGPHGRGQQ